MEVYATLIRILQVAVHCSLLVSSTWILVSVAELFTSCRHWKKVKTIKKQSLSFFLSSPRLSLNYPHFYNNFSLFCWEFVYFQNNTPNLKFTKLSISNYAMSFFPTYNSSVARNSWLQNLKNPRWHLVAGSAGSPQSTGYRFCGLFVSPGMMPRGCHAHLSLIWLGSSTLWFNSSIIVCLGAVTNYWFELPFKRNTYWITYLYVYNYTLMCV